MYYTRLPQVRRVGQRLSNRLNEDQFAPADPSSDIFEFGSEGQVDETITELELCKGLMYPVD